MKTQGGSGKETSGTAQSKGLELGAGDTAEESFGGTVPGSHTSQKSLGLRSASSAVTSAPGGFGLWSQHRLPRDALLCVHRLSTK